MAADSVVILILNTILFWIATVARAVRRARCSIFTVAGAYGLSLLVGIIMVHTGNVFALKTRDQLVNQSNQQNPAALAANQGDNLRAALWDFAGNLVFGAVPKTISGFAIIFPYPMIAYQGWVGGIVSVRGDHTSRLNDPRSGVYYLLTLLLQLTPYSLAIGAGVNVGVALFRPQSYYQDQKWLGAFPKEALRDVGRIYALVIPLFLVASLWEFLSPWNL
jgi:uncharacterized membrane protein SpoIIM required for sporulation